MAKRKPGNNKRQPRMNGVGLNGPCISIKGDSAEYFTPKPRPKRKQLRKDASGKYHVVIVEKALL